jgi:hypothetical protein
VAEPASDATRDGALAYLGQLSKLCEGEPELLLVHGADEADAISEITVAYDLVVIGDRPGVNVREKLFGNEVEKITADASCSVIRLKTPRAITRMSLMPPVPGRAEVTTPTPDG